VQSPVVSEFCGRLPDELLWVTNLDTGERLQVVPGALRGNHVKVGRHFPPDPEDINVFLG
jgi:hypothetical protein